MNAEQSTAYREGQTLGQLDSARGHYRPNLPKSAEERAGYEAGWDAAFFAKVQARRGQQLNLQIQNQP